jgi:homoserine O-acetyltransferase
VAVERFGPGPGHLQDLGVARRLVRQPGRQALVDAVAPQCVLDTMTRLREDTLRRYGIDESLAARLPDKAARDAEILKMARTWAEAFDGHSLLALGRAMNRYDVRPDLAKIRARVLYVLSRTDKLFPPSLAAEVMPALAAAGVDATYEEIDSEHGHLASGSDSAKWEPALRRFLAEL